VSGQVAVERQVRIERLVHGGEELARDTEGVLFVPLVAAGDLVRVKVDAARGGARHASLLEVLEPGPGRIAPPCPHVGACGGCDRQHLTQAAQEAAKHEAVAEALARIGGLDLASLRPLVPSPLSTRYRRRIRVQPVKDGWGYSERGSHRAVRVPACLLAEEAVEALANRFMGPLKKLGLPPVASVGLDVAAGRGAVHVALQETPGPLIQAKASRLLREVEGLQGLVLSGPTGAPVAVGDPVLIDREHHGLRIRPDLFAQANRLGARAMAEYVASTVSPGASVLELFAGAGTLTLPLAKRAGTIVATEGEGPSLTLLRSALSEFGFSARLVGGPAKTVVSGLASESARFDHVVLDPPRAGAKETLEGLVRLAPPRITYVSCDPATFARDAKTLLQAGWRLEETVPFDLFPQTHHVELVATLSRG
jgi:23S rRNA (uracil1939-C5)-methyltransferase